MSDNKEEAVAGPSNLKNLKSTDSSKTIPKKSVHFDSDSSAEAQKNVTLSQSRARRQSLMGKSGFVSQLLDQHLEEKSPEASRREEEFRKPIRKQTLAERRASVKEVGANVSSYMKDTIIENRRKSLGIKSIRRGTSILPTLSSKESVDKLNELATLLPVETRPSSEWRPSDLLENEVGCQQELSWVGTYVVGKDYWADEECNGEETDRKVTFGTEEERTPWYDMPIQKSIKESIFKNMKNRTLHKIEVLKGEIDEDYEEKRKRRMIAAAHARQEPKFTEEWSEEFKQCFNDVTRSTDFCYRPTYISMVDSDKWLEKAEILDHSQLTLIHTGLCFLASGGSRHRGLSFGEFTQFLQMISHTTKLPLRGIIRRLTACKREVPGRSNIH